MKFLINFLVILTFTVGIRNKFSENQNGNWTQIHRENKLRYKKKRLALLDEDFEISKKSIGKF